VLGSGALACRGGLCIANRFTRGSGVTLDAGRRLHGVSVNSAVDTSVEDLTATIPNRQIGVTTVGQIEALGGTVTPRPTPDNRHHCVLSGITPREAEDLFTPTIPNPSIS